MLTVIISIVVVFVLFAGMAIGVIVQDKPVKGTCGGLANLGLKQDCKICGGNDDKCDEITKEKQKSFADKKDHSYSIK